MDSTSEARLELSFGTTRGLPLQHRINDALLQFETDLNRNLLPEPQRALPTLDQIAGDPRFVDIARQRARNLAQRIRHQS